MDALTRRAGGASFVLDIIINGFLAGVFVVFFNFARQGMKCAFRVGMILHTLDGLVMLLFKAYLGFAFHACLLFSMNGGIVAISKLKELEQASLPSS